MAAPDHEIIAVTPEMTELRQQCYDIRVAVFVDEQGEFAHQSRFASLWLWPWLGFSIDEEFDKWFYTVSPQNRSNQDSGGTRTPRIF